MDDGDVEMNQLDDDNDHDDSIAHRARAQPFSNVKRFFFHFVMDKNVSNKI